MVRGSFPRFQVSGLYAPREMIKTPILQTEHIRGVEPKADFLIAGGTDFLRMDPEYYGITGGLKIAHLGEAFGIDVEVHACGPAHRHIMSAMRNSNFYEGFGGAGLPECCSSGLCMWLHGSADCVDGDGCVPVPDGPGLGLFQNGILKGTV